MSVRKRVSAVLIAAAFFFTSIPAGTAFAGLQARSVEGSGSARISPRDGTQLLARHKKWKRRLRRARRRTRRQLRRVEKRVIRPTVRRATPAPLRPLRKKISRQIKRTQKRVGKQVKRSGGQVGRQVKRSGGQVGKEAKRTGRRVEKETRRTTKRVGKELSRTGKRVDREVRRLRKQLVENQALGILVKVAVATFLGPQALVLLNSIEAAYNLARSRGKGADFLRTGLNILGPAAGNPAGRALLRLAQDVEKLRTKGGREAFIKGVLADKAGIDVRAVERLGTPEGRREFLRTVANPAERSRMTAVFGVLDQVDSMNLRPDRNPDAVIRSLAPVVGSPRVINAVLQARDRAQAIAARDFSVADRALQTSTAPNVLGLRYARALSMLENVGLTHRIASYLPATNPALTNRVVRQIPGPNTPVADNTVVMLTLYRAPVAGVPTLARPPVPRPARPAGVRPGRRVIAKPIITDITPSPVVPGSVITIHGRNFNPNARLNRVRVPVGDRRRDFRRDFRREKRFGAGRRSRRRFSYRFVRALSSDPQGTQLRVRLPRTLRTGRSAYILVHNGRAYSPYFRLEMGAAASARPTPSRPPRRVAAARGVVPNLMDRPIGAALALLQNAGYRPGNISFRNTGNCDLSRRVRWQSPIAGQRRPRGTRVNLQAFWCMR